MKKVQISENPGRRAFLATLAGAAAASGSTLQQSSRPNIILLVADDLGSGDVGFRGCKDIRTPNLDRLAAEGVQFTQAYSNGPVCSPTRAALLTGQYQQRTGIDGVIYVSERERGLSPSSVLIPEVLKESGYATGLFGKWHLGYPEETFPTRQGFDEFIGFLAGNIDYFHHVDRQRNPDLWNREKLIKDQRYVTDIVGDESINFIDRHAGRPFFLYAPFSSPHDPFQGPDNKPAEPFGEVATRATYGRMVESMDQNIGRILERVRSRKLDNNTVVFFLSDNGGVPKVASNAPFRGYKGSLWEGGIRTPLVARWTGQFPAGSRVADPVAGMDLFPTALAVAGASVPRDRKIDGVNLLDVCRGKGKLRRNSLHFQYQAPKQRAQSAVIRNGWKYLMDVGGNEHLFHLSEDIGEQNNLATAQPDRLKDMKREHTAWLADVKSS
jgi:arylsulfatase A